MLSEVVALGDQRCDRARLRVRSRLDAAAEGAPPRSIFVYAFPLSLGTASRGAGVRERPPNAG